MKTGLVHGRFQPPHNGHIRYIISALENADHILIGICTPEICTKEESLRTGYPCTAELNPYTYEERVEMLTLALDDISTDKNRYSFVPFPSNYKNIENIVPKDTVFFISKTSSHDDAKIRAIENAGFKTEKIIEIDEGINRERSGHIREQGLNWENMVPETIAKYIKERKA